MKDKDRLSVAECLALTDDEAECKISQMRWNDGPIRGISCDHDQLYRITTRKKFNCARCGRQFSVTSGTVFHGTKISLQQCVAGLVFYLEREGKVTAAEMAHAIGVTNTAARVFNHKLFEVVCAGDLNGRSVLTAGYFQGFTRLTQVNGALYAQRPRDGALRAL